MENTRSIDRTNKGANEVIMQDVPRSGMDMSYTSHDGGIPLGRLIPITYQKLMAGAKYRLSNRANLTFEQLSTPLLGNVDICQHNFFVPYRAVDKSFETLMTPTKLDGMGSSSVAPSFSFNNILKGLCTILNDFVVIGQITSSSVRFRFNFRAFSVNYGSLFQRVYLDDALIDLYDQMLAHIGQTPSNGIVEITIPLNSSSEASRLSAIVIVVLQDFFDFFVGKRSLLDKFGYYYVTHKMVADSIKFFLQLPLESKQQVTTDFNWHNFLSSVAPWYRHNYPLQNEYALRAYYSIWFEYYRNFDIEPRSATLPEWKSFANSSILSYVHQNPSELWRLSFLIPRIRSWAKDPFIAAGIDDISRHVFAPVLDFPSMPTVIDNSLAPSAADYSAFGALSTIDTSWRNPNTGNVQNLTLILPSSILTQLRDEVDGNEYGLSLTNLRRANMLENWLKRIYYGGDEYRDRMLSLYGARIEDYRINRPEWLSSSLDSRDVKQEVSNSGAPAGSSVDGMASIGTRTATATATQNGSDVTSNYTPEFGIYIGILSVMPRATYDTLNYQNLELKNADFPIPQFAHSMEECILSSEVCRQSLDLKPFGYAAYGHAYRGRVDEVHGDYLDVKFDYVFSRSFDDTNDFTKPQLNYGFIHCRPYLPMFVNKVLLDGQVYGTFMHDFFVENPLPTPVETI